MSRSIRSVVAHLELDLAIGPSTRPFVSVEVSRDGMCLQGFRKGEDERGKAGGIRDGAERFYGSSAAELGIFFGVEGVEGVEGILIED